MALANLLYLKTNELIGFNVISLIQYTLKVFPKSN
jgi:hypothetical protein